VKEKIVLPHFILFLEKKSLTPFELKLIITRKIRRAVDRNRIKRVVREFFRQKSGLLPWKSVICRIAPSAEKIKNAELFQELNQIL